MHCRQILYCLSHQGSPHTSTKYPTNRSSDHWKDQGPAGGWHQTETGQRLKYQNSFSLPYPDAAGVGFVSARDASQGSTVATESSSFPWSLEQGLQQPESSSLLYLLHKSLLESVALLRIRSKTGTLMDVWGVCD